jgi:hypothetical protein
VRLAGSQQREIVAINWGQKGRGKGRFLYREVERASEMSDGEQKAWTDGRPNEVPVAVPKSPRSFMIGQ